MLSKERRSLPQHPIYKESIEQFGRELSNFFPPDYFNDRQDVPSFLVKQNEDLKDVRDQYKSKGFAIPLFTYSPDTLSPDKDLRNNGFLRRHGLVTSLPRKQPSKEIRLEDPWLSYNVLYLTSAALNINIYYYCSYSDQYDFAPMWQQAAEGRYLDFKIDIENSSIFFKVDLSPDVTMASIDLDNSSYVQFATSAVLHTYHGVGGKNKPVTSMKVNTGIIEHGDIPNKKVLPSMSITREKSRTFSIKNSVEGDK